MHSRIIELGNAPILPDDRMGECSVPEWFYHSIADYTNAETDRDEDLKWFLEIVAHIVDVAEDGESFTFKPNAKKKYFHRQYYAFLDKARELTGISIEAFCAETPYDIGAFFLPIHTRDLMRRICLHERYAEGLTDERDMNMTPGPCPSLYCDRELRNDPDNGHSYLGWNEAEKAYYITDWIGYIAEWLSKLGYHLDGKMFAVVEGGMSYYTITVDGDKVTSEEFIPDATYVDEFYACEESEDT